MKRAFDLLAALVLLLPTLFLMAVLAPLIRLDSPGSPIFRQTRVGRNEVPFTLVKFRTMRTDTGDRPSHEVGAASMTRMGPFLRKTKIDELPQVLAVLSGAMSFVGPRPCLPSQTELIEARREQDAFSVRPGITGLAQIDGLDMSQPRKLALVDGEYVRRRTMALDLSIFVRTALGKGRGDAARK